MKMNFMLAMLPLMVATSVLAAVTPENTALIKRGEYLAIAGDCTACHTAPGADKSAKFGGGYPLASPFGVIYGTNISSDKEFGIGNWTDEEFVRAVREGVGKEGQQLYPAMPYDSFTKMKRDEVLAIKAYLMSQPAVHSAGPQTDLSFPFNQRWGMRVWKWFNFDKGELKNDPSKSADWNRGAYLVEALEHCGTCHTPRTLTMGMDNDKALSGGDLGAWTAFNITPDKNAGIGNWSQEELVAYLKTGFVAGKASASGAMAEAIEHSLQHLSDSDLNAIATYIRSVPAVGDEKQTKPRDAWGQKDRDVYPVRAQGLSMDKSAAALFNASCAACHGKGGEGIGAGFHAYPSLFHHSSTGSYDNRNQVSVILNGVQRHMEKGEVMMPSFANQLDDEQIATLSNYVSKQFGNPAAATVTAKDVGEMRKAADLTSPPEIEEGTQK
ncbi:c-type cytochrome [Rahnella inusitata]|uniref:c-type cytochrome n=1 Tax=Rahnella inusitata TaxID=58169 RepID=UPI0039B005D5